VARDKKRKRKISQKGSRLMITFPSSLRNNKVKQFFFFEVVAQLLVGWNVENVYDGHNISISMGFYGVKFFVLSISV
jgi:hypothetical protein